MWIFAPGGLLMPSTFPRDKVDPQYMNEADTFDLQVRVRAKSHLDNFVRDFLDPMALEHSEIQATPGMDYNFRLYMSKKDFATAMAAMVFDIDYDKFKPTAERRDEEGALLYKEGKEYHSVLNSIWGTVCRLGSPGGMWAVGSRSSRVGSEYDAWWKDRTRTFRGENADALDEDLFPQSRRGSRWWDDDEFGDGSLAEEIGAGIEDAEDDDSYTPSSQERVWDILLTVSGLPAAQWDDHLTAEELALVTKEREAKFEQERRERRMTFLGRRRKKDRKKA